MKFIFCVTITLALILLLIIQKTKQDSFVQVPEPLNETISKELPQKNRGMDSVEITETKTSESEFDNLEHKISKLELQIKDIKHKLEIKGFPGILNDPRTNEFEREELVNLLDRQAILENQLMDSQIKKINIETSIEGIL